MRTHHDNRELSTKLQPEDKTDYQALDSRGRPKVLGQAEADNEMNTSSQESERPHKQSNTSITGPNYELTEEGFRELCREAMDDPRSMDPVTLLFEILVRVRARAGESDPRGSIPVEYETTSGETYWKEIEEIVSSKFNGQIDVKGILTEVIEENTERRER